MTVARPHFEGTITLGTVLQIVVMLLGLWGATVRLESRMTAIETKLDPLWSWFMGLKADNARGR